MTPSQQKPINLLRGWPAPSLLPSASLLRAAQTCLTTESITIPGLQYGPDPGYEPLREELATWLSAFYGGSVGGKEVEADPDPKRICISGGASQNLARLLQVFADPGVTTVWLVSPCYFLAKCIFEDAGLSCYDVGEGDEGVDLRMLEEEMRLCQHEGGKPVKRTTPYSKIYRHIIYGVPTFSNPSGKTMTLSARRRLVELARQHNALIITDDVYDFLQWPTAPTTPPSSLTHAILPRIVDIDRTLDPVPSSTSFGNAVSNGTFSKIAGPGVRTGWAEATPTFAYGLSQCGSAVSGGAPSQLTATIMAEMLKTGDLQRHIEEVLKPAYKKRYEVMIGAIRKYLLPLGIKLGETSFGGDDVFGGYFIWIELPEIVNAEVVAARAKVKENLIVAPGALFEASRGSDIKFENFIRLCFSWELEEDLLEGIQRLARVVEDVMGCEVSVGESVEGGLGEFK